MDVCADDGDEGGPQPHRTVPDSASPYLTLHITKGDISTLTTILYT